MPYLAAIFVVVGTLIGVARGGRLYRIAENVPRAWPLLPFGVALVLQSGHPGLPGAKWVHLAGYGYLLAFALANLRRTVAATLLVIAVVANGAVIVANGRMPYVQSAAVNVGAYHGASDLNPDHPTREWVTPDTRLPELARKYEVKPTHEVVSVGDLVLSLAAGWLAMYMLLPSRRRLARLRPVEYRTTSAERAVRRRSARQGRRRTNSLTPLDPTDHTYDIVAIRTDEDEIASPHGDLYAEPYAETGPEPWAAHETGPEPAGQYFAPEYDPTAQLPTIEAHADRRYAARADRFLPDGPHEVPAGWAIDESAFAPNDALLEEPDNAVPRDTEAVPRDTTAVPSDTNGEPTERNPWRARDDH